MAQIKAAFSPYSYDILLRIECRIIELQWRFIGDNVVLLKKSASAGTYDYVELKLNSTETSYSNKLVSR